MSVTIRPAEQRDLEALGALGASLIRDHYAFDPQRFLAPRPDAPSGYAWFLGTQLDGNESAVFVAEADERVAGYVYVTVEPMSWMELRGPAGFVHDVVVREDARRSGIATALLDAATQWLRERGAPRVILWTASGNTGAHALFHRFGFRDTMIEMTKELEP